MGEPEGAGGFSSYLLGHRLLYYFHRNADNILIGRYLGATALGAYALAYNIMLVPFTRIAGPVQRVLGPAFARMQDEPRRIADAWVRAVRLVGALAILSLLGLMVVAPDFVSVVLGDQWAAAVPLIQVLAIVGIVQSLQSISTDILQARGQANTIFRFSVLFTVTHTAGFVVGLAGVGRGRGLRHHQHPGGADLHRPHRAFDRGLALARGARAAGIFEASALMTAVVLLARLGLVEPRPGARLGAVCAGLGLWCSWPPRPGAPPRHGAICAASCTTRWAPGWPACGRGAWRAWPLGPG